MMTDVSQIVELFDVLVDLRLSSGQFFTHTCATNCIPGFWHPLATPKIFFFPFDPFLFVRSYFISFLSNNLFIYDCLAISTLLSCLNLMFQYRITHLLFLCVFLLCGYFC